MDYLSNYIKPELMILIPVLYLIGVGLKKSQGINDRFIPLLLGVAGVLLATVYVLGTMTVTGWQNILGAVFVAVTQGVLCAGASVYVNQLIKQASEK